MYTLKTKITELKTTNPDVVAAVLAVQEKEGKEYLPIIEEKKKKVAHTKKRWTFEDFEFVVHNMNKDNSVMALKLGRTVHAVRVLKSHIRHKTLKTQEQLKWLNKIINQ